MAKKVEKVSNRGMIRKLVETKGADAAIEWGLKQGMLESTVYAYVQDWIKIKGLADKAKASKLLKAREEAKAKAKSARKSKAPAKKAKAKSEAPAPAKKVSRVVPTELFELNYKHHSLADAQQRRDAICKASGCSPDCFRIMRKGDLWAVGPRHRDPSAPIPTFSKGDSVMGLGWSVLGTIKEPGPQQSLVAWDTGVTQSENNHYLVLAPQAKTASKAKAKPAKKKK